MWSDILKKRRFGPNDDTSDAEWGDIIIKPDGSKFVVGQGFSGKSYQKDKAPIKRDKEGNILEPFETDEEGEYTKEPQTRVGTKQELVNWFNTIIQESYDRFLERLGTKFVTTNEQDEMMLNRDETASSKGMKRVGMEIAQQNIESMVEGYLTSISGDTGRGEPPKSFSDSSTNIQGIMGSSAYGKILDAALKFTELQLSGIFDVQQRVQQRAMDAPDDYEDEEEEDFTGEPSKEWADSNWRIAEGNVANLTQGLINNVDDMLDDIIGDGDTSIADLDGDGQPDINNVSIGKEIKTSLLNLYQEPTMKKLLKDFTNYVGFNFIIKIVRGQIDMQDSEVADQVTEQQAEEMRNRPEIEFDGEDYDEEARRKLEDEFKSNDRYTGELDWFSILSKGAGKGLTSNAGFRPAIANVSYKPPCKNCKDKKSPCGCGK
tara:strand:- start:740 stop:2035 length:1296 start_codon:yes stop_codon:yes gene_type:complete